MEEAFVLPHRLMVPVRHDLPLETLVSMKSPIPIGLLEVEILEAENLIAADVFFIGGSREGLPFHLNQLTAMCGQILRCFIAEGFLIVLALGCQKENAGAGQRLLGPLRGVHRWPRKDADLHEEEYAQSEVVFLNREKASTLTVAYTPMQVSRRSPSLALVARESSDVKACPQSAEPNLLDGPDYFLVYDLSQVIRLEVFDDDPVYDDYIGLLPGSKFYSTHN
eukprot:3170790-Amphidinium_carterae.1